jgi:hypothetical protein
MMFFCLSWSIAHRVTDLTKIEIKDCYEHKLEDFDSSRQPTKAHNTMTPGHVVSSV